MVLTDQDIVVMEQVEPQHTCAIILAYRIKICNAHIDRKFNQFFV